MPDLIHDPGLNAGYRRGHVSNQCVKIHFTVGTDSHALIKNEGLAQFLVPKETRPVQFAEADAVCADSCEWNVTGPGIEFERLSDKEPLTPSQIEWGGRIIHWLSENYGYPLSFYDGPRLAIGDPFRGFVTHRSLVHKKCDQHTDYITPEDFAAMIGEDDLNAIQNQVLADTYNNSKAILDRLSELEAKVDANQSLFRRFFPRKSAANP